MAKYTEYDKTAEYENSIKELLHELEIRLRECGIPFFFTAAVKNGTDGTVYKNEMYSPTEAESILYNDLFPKHLNVLNGFNTIPYSNQNTWDFDSFSDDESE